MSVVDPVSGDPDRSIHHTGHTGSLHPQAVHPEAQVRYELYNVDISVRNDGRLNSHPRLQGGRVICRQRSWDGVLPGEVGRGREGD